MQKVSFNSQAATLVGDLYLPDGTDTSAPAVVILGPMTFVKEQAPTQYAHYLAERGFAALAFDPRFRDESGGEPKDLESPMSKVEDVLSAVAFLSTHPDVASDKIATLAICQGSSEMLRAAADDPSIKALATVEGHYRDAEGDLAWLGEEGLARRRTRGEVARAYFEATGEVEYVPAVDPERTDVGMPGRFVWDWYHSWAERGVWPNRYAVMSDAELLPYESASAASRLQTPYLMIHSDNSFLPDVARRQFELVPTPQKKLLWEGETAHFQYYDDPVVIERAVASIGDWFEKYLHPAMQVSAAKG